MLTLLLVLASALSAEPVAMGTLQVDAHIPSDVVVDGVRLAQLYIAGKLEVPMSAGTHEVFITTNGIQRRMEVVVAEGEVARVLVGRNGLSGDLLARKPLPTDVTPTEFRATGEEGIEIRIGTQRVRVAPGAATVVDLVPGEHPCTMRNLDGTVIWARGTLHVAGPEVVVVQLTEGRAPEISGEGSFSASTGG
jgi:hypothetical protein